MSTGLFTEEEAKQDSYLSLYQATLDYLRYWQEREREEDVRAGLEELISSLISIESKLPTYDHDNISWFTNIHDIAKAMAILMKEREGQEKPAETGGKTRTKKILKDIQPNYQLFAEATAEAPALLTDRTFRTIRQGGATNALTKLRAMIDKNAKLDPISKTATISKGNFTLTIPNYDKLSGLKTSTYQLLDAITIAFTESGAKSPTVAIPLTAYMSLRGLKDRKEAKNQVKADLEVLRQASITGEEKRGKNTTAYSFVNIADSGEVRRNGDIVFTFGTTFYNMLLGYPIMNYPAQLQTLNSNRNPNSYYLLRKIAEHKNMNVGKLNEDIIAVKTLLSVAPFIPPYEDVMAGNKNIADRIIKPFERDMDALENTLEWTYWHSNNVPLTGCELDNISYDLFKDLLIRVEWKSYPDQTARLERKAERLEQAKKTRKRTPAKKKTDTE